MNIMDLTEMLKVSYHVSLLRKGNIFKAGYLIHTYKNN